MSSNDKSDARHMSVPAEYRNGDVSLPEDAAEIKRLREAIEGILGAWPRYLFDVPQESVDRFVAAMDHAQALVNPPADPLPGERP